MPLDIQEIMAAARQGDLAALDRMLPEAEGFHTSNAATAALQARQLPAFEKILPALSAIGRGGALTMACHHGIPDAVERLLAVGVPAEGHKGDGEPLQRVLANWDPSRDADYAACLQHLLTAGVDVNRPGHLGITPILDVARTGCSVRAAQGLVEAGADLLAMDDKGWVLPDWLDFDYAGRDKSPLSDYLRPLFDEANQ